MTPTEEAIKIVMQTIADIIYVDPHSWSARPCSTCRAISAATKVDFGCVRKAKEAMKK